MARQKEGKGFDVYDNKKNNTFHYTPIYLI